MRILITFLSLFFISFIYGQKSNKDLNCYIKISKKKFIEQHLDLKCTELDTSIVASYKLKLRGYKTISVKGNILNSNAINIIKRSKVGDYIIIFDIIFKPKGDYLQNYDLEKKSKRRLKSITAEITR